MMPYRSIVTWQPVLTDHMAWTLEALAAQADARLTHVVAVREDVIRRKQGWARTSREVVVLPGRGWLGFVRQRLASERDALHIFGSPFTEARVMFAFFLALWSGRTVCLVSEPYSPSAVGYLDDARGAMARFRAVLRPWLYRAYGLLMRRHLRVVFAISPLAVRQFAAIGVQPQRIVPFGYFVPSAVARTEVAPEIESAAPVGLALVFVGSLIERKGLLPLIDAVKALSARNVRVRLDVFGSGDPGRYPFDGTIVRYRGTVPFGQAQAVIAGYDALVLPSLHDGWGVVVNEALQAGVPVVCSNAVGAGAMLRKWRCGRVYEQLGEDSLEAALEALALDRRGLAEMRENARLIQPVLRPDFAAAFMWNALLEAAAPGKRPGCPWYDRDA